MQRNRAYARGVCFLGVRYVSNGNDIGSGDGENWAKAGKGEYRV